MENTDTDLRLLAMNLIDKRVLSYLFYITHKASYNLELSGFHTAPKVKGIHTPSGKK